MIKGLVEGRSGEDSGDFLERLVLVHGSWSVDDLEDDLSVL